MYEKYRKYDMYPKLTKKKPINHQNLLTYLKIVTLNK